MMSGTPFNAKKLYRSFLYSDRPFLSFHEFLLGLCALEKNTSHGGTTGELRCGYIFRYYNESNDKKGLTFDDIKQLIKDIIKSQSEGQLDESKIEAEARLISNCITGVSAEAQIKSQRIDEKTFMKSIGERRLRGTSVLFRLVVSTLQQIRMKRVYESIQLYRNKSMTAIETKIQKIKGTCLRCRQKKYSLAVHTVLLSRSLECRHLWKIQKINHKLHGRYSGTTQLPLRSSKTTRTCLKNRTPTHTILVSFRTPKEGQHISFQSRH